MIRFSNVPVAAMLTRLLLTGIAQFTSGDSITVLMFRIFRLSAVASLTSDDARTVFLHITGWYSLSFKDLQTFTKQQILLFSRKQQTWNNISVCKSANVKMCKPNQYQPVSIVALLLDWVVNSITFVIVHLVVFVCMFQPLSGFNTFLAAYE